MSEDISGGPPPATPRNGDEAGSDRTSSAPPEPRSGLRNPAGAVRGLGATTLVIETVVLLLAIQPIRLLGGELSGAAIGAVLTLAVLAVVLAGLLRRSWAWHGATVLQAVLMLAGFLHWSLGVLGILFGAVWVYVLYVRRTILG